MSQYSYEQVVPVKETNGLGLAGFICSLIGIVFTGGVLCPVGLIMSLIAVGRRPRGFAIAGIILGLLGTCGGLLIIGGLVVGFAAIAAWIAMLAVSNPQKLEMTMDMITIAKATQDYQHANKYLPASLSLLSLEESTLKDPWGQPYLYDLIDPKGGDFDLVSSGADKTFETPDDVKLSKLGEAWAPDGTIHIEGNNIGGTVKVGARGSKIEVAGDDKGGKVQIKIGDRVIEVAGDDTGGHVDVGPAPKPVQPVPPETPSNPTSPPGTP